MMSTSTGQSKWVNIRYSQGRICTKVSLSVPSV